MATVAARYPQNLISCRSSWSKEILIGENPCMGLGCGTPKSLRPKKVLPWQQW